MDKLMPSFFRDLFFMIWADDFGCGWIIFITILALILVGTIVTIFARRKAINKKFISKSTISLMLLFLFAIYQFVPIYLFFNGIANVNPNTMQKAIKTSIIPWQKGAFYCELGRIFRMKKEGKKSIEAYNKAYAYLKSYKYPCWGISFLDFYNIEKYDTAIEMAEFFYKGHKLPISNQFLSQCYLMKGDLEKALEYSNKEIEYKPTASEFAKRGFIKNKLKISGANEDYKKAFSLCKNKKEVIQINAMYSNFINYEKKRLLEQRQKHGFEK